MKTLVQHWQTIFCQLLLVTSLAAAPSGEDELDAMFGGGSKKEESDKQQDSDSSAMKLRINGYVENETFFNVPVKPSTTDGKVAKLEGHLNLITEYGSEKFFFHSEIDAFFYPERGELSQNNPHENRSIELQELYMSAGTDYRFRMGKMRVDHSAADAFSVINFMAQRDFREVFGIRKNVRDRGIFAAALKGVWGDFMAEGIVTPLHNPPLFPVANSFMTITPGSQRIVNPVTSTTMALSPELLTDNSLGPDLRHASAVLRTGGTVAGVDFHLLYFNGIDPSLFLRPTTTLDWGGDVTKSSIVLEPIYNKVETYAFDLAWAYKRFSTRLEAAYTPAKWLVLKDEMETRTILGDRIISRNKLAREQFLAYTVGFDIKLYSDESMLLAEFTQSQPLKNKSAYQQEFLTEILLVRLEDKFFDNRLTASVGGIVRALEKKPGFATLAQVGWDFENGLELTGGATIFVGNNDEVLAPFEDKDFFFTNIKMSF